MAKLKVWKCFSVWMVLVLVAALGAAMLTPGAVGANGCVNPVYVNGTTGNDAWDGSSPTPGTPPVGPKKTIQAGIGAVCGGGVVNVAAGAYTENVNVNKSVTLQGASSATVTVTAANPATSVFNVTASSVNISGFTVSGATGGGQAGIFLGGGVANCNISNNILTGSFDGIWLGAGSNHNTLTNNTLSSNYQGFEVYISNYNTFTNNIASSNSNYGFKIDSGDHNTFTNNIASSNTKYGFYVVIGDGGGATNSTFTNNTANLNTQYGIRINGGSGNTLTGNTFNANVLEGIRLKEAITNLTLNYNSFTNSPIGIDIDTSVTDVTQLTVSYNNIVGNTVYGVSNAGTGTLNAENNWWGCNDGPGVVGPGSGDKVSANVSYNPWLVLKLSADPAIIPAGGISTSTITADMTDNSNGVDSGGYVPDGTEVVFTTDKGSIGSLTTTKTTTSGIATAVFTSDTSPGPATISANAATCYECTTSFPITVITAWEPGASPSSSRAGSGQLNPPQVSVQYVSVNPQQSYANQPLTITANVVNTGDEGGNYNLALKINGQVEQSRMVSVGPQGSQPVKFTVTRTQPGTYTVDISGQKGSFIILGAGHPAGKPVNGGLIALIVMAVLILATAAVLALSFRRRAY